MDGSDFVGPILSSSKCHLRVHGGLVFKDLTYIFNFKRIRMC